MILKGKAEQLRYKPIPVPSATLSTTNFLVASNNISIQQVLFFKKFVIGKWQQRLNVAMLSHTSAASHMIKFDNDLLKPASGGFLVS
jgi:hypothetical protein